MEVIPTGRQIMVTDAIYHDLMELKKSLKAKSFTQALERVLPEVRNSKMVNRRITILFNELAIKLEEETQIRSHGFTAEMLRLYMLFKSSNSDVDREKLIRRVELAISAIKKDWFE